MKKIAVLLLFTAFLFSWANTSSAKSGAETSRMRLLLHGTFDLPEEQMELRAHFVPGPNLNIGLAPIGYLGLGFKPASWLDVEPVIGYNFQFNEVLYSLRVKTQYEKIYAWIDYEYRPDSQSAYWLGQVEFIMQPWLHLGFEEESWGTYQNQELFSHGWGPNILLRQKNYGADLVFARRQIGDGETMQEFFLRIHLYF